MKKALIDPATPVQQITGWVANPNIPAIPSYLPVYEQIANSARVCEVANVEFPVTPELFWVDCADDVVADQWYYNTVTTEIIVIPPAPPVPSGVLSV